MNYFASLTVIALLATGCSPSKQDEQVLSNGLNNDPPNVNPIIEFNRKVAEGKRRGFGSCDDIYRVQELPLLEMGGDEYFFRIKGNIKDYRHCLVAFLNNETPVLDPYRPPAREGYTYGAFAYDILLLSGEIDDLACEPPLFRNSIARDIYEFHTWFRISKNRHMLKACLEKQFSGT